MGVYNPDAPQILGQEWVPIRNENFQFQPDITAQEVGYSFNLATPRQVSNARFYVNTLPANQPDSHMATVNIYPAGREALSGPIRKLIIPINDSSAFSAPHGGFNGSAATAQEALASPADFKGIFADPSPGPSTLSVEFNTFYAVNDYAQLLTGKRILNVSLIYSGAASMQDDTGKRVAYRPATSVNGFTPTIVQLISASANVTYGLEIVGPLGALNGLSNVAPDPNNATGTQAGQVIARLSLGDVSPFPLAGTNVTHWTLGQLKKLDLRNGLDAKIYIAFQQAPADVETNPLSGTFLFQYAALEVTYCEEARVAIGSTKLLYSSGLNVMQVTDLNFNLNPILPAGDYTATIGFANPGDRAFFGGSTAGPYAGINAIREKYALPSMPGVEVDIPFPSFNKVGDVFTKKTTHIIPQLTLHASGAPLTEPHVYGRQAVAQVFGSITATQNLLDSAVGAGFSFPWVRFYARRYGNTTVPLTLTGASPTVSGSSVSITPGQFDSLTEVLDGWKEITLRFTNIPSMGTGVTPSWTWSATGELPGNRWEVLGAAAPAVSGTIQNEYNNPGPPSAQLGVSTYGQPAAGTTVELTWMPGIYPAVSGSTPDPNSDATLLFSQDMPTVTGFTVLTANQPLTGVSLDCNTFPWYVPSALSYNQISWSSPAGLILDTFSTPAVSGWSPADTGQTWTVSDGSTSRFSVSGGTGNISIGTLNTNHGIDVNLGTPNQDLTIFVTLPTLLTGSGSAAIDLRIRKLDSNNFYSGRLTFNVGGVIDASLSKTVAGVGATLGNPPSMTHVAGHTYGMRVSAIGTLIQMKAWDATAGSEPLWWQISTTNAELTTGNLATVFAFFASTITNTLPYVVSYDNLTSSISTFGYYELQRLDTLTDWQDIAKLTSPFATGFRDYEARVGLLSSYRIRAVNDLLFPGPWSSTITSTLSAPGVTGQGMGVDARTLLFTSNYGQNGSKTLAYAMAFGSDTTENFNFPEAGFTQFQFMYGRDFQTAFRPLERGGETFSRTVLVQAAAIPPPTLADFKSLRDMAWDTIPYVCVRDEDGNRWFANVTVPQGRVQGNKREIYLADINVVQVTDTAGVVTI